MAQRVLGIGDLLAPAAVSARDWLGSDRAVDTVLRPFLAGVFLESELVTNSVQSALVSGRRAAEAVPADLGKTATMAA